MNKISSVILFVLLVLPVYTVDLDLLKKNLSLSDGKKKVEILIKLSNEYLDIDLEKSKNYLNQVEKMIVYQNDPVLKIDYYNLKSAFQTYQSNYKESMKFAEISLQIAEKLKNTNKLAESLLIYGRALNGTNKFKEALETYNRALELNSSTKDLLLKGRLNLYIGHVHNNRSELNIAKGFYENALKIFSSIKNKMNEAEALRMVGSIYLSQDDYPTALKYLIKVLKFYEKSLYKRRHASVLNDIGILYANLKNNKKALELFLQSSVIAKKENDQDLISTLLNNIGTIYEDNGEFDKALEYYFRALKFERKKDNKLGIAIDLFNIGSIYVEKNQLGNAESYLMESLQISQDIKDQTGVVMSYTSLAQVYKRQNKFQKALNYLQKALKETEGIGSKELMRSIYEEYSLIYTASHEYNKSTIYKNKAKKLRKEILNEKSAKKIAETRTRFETEKKEVEIEKLKLDKSLRRHELNEKELQKNIVIVGLLIGLIIIILLYRQFRLKNTSNKLIKSKNVELEKAYKKLELVAATDPLTKLSNRRDILQKISYELDRFKRYKRVFTLIICDIDNFKLINDQYGHDAGDIILVSISDILSDNVRQQDTVSRWGGEEFLIFVPETDLKGGFTLAEKIRKKINEHKFTYKETSFNVSLTFGVSEFREGMDLDKCINDADQALYKGKKEGKNIVILRST